MNNKYTDLFDILIKSYYDGNFDETLNKIITCHEKSPQETFEIIKNKENLLIVGGNKSVPKAMEDKLNNNYIKIGRLEGKDRYETSQKIVSSLFVDNNKLLISDGKDDLGAGIVAAGYCFENDRPLLMVKKGNKINENLKKKDLLYLTKKAYEDLN